MILLPLTSRFPRDALGKRGEALDELVGSKLLYVSFCAKLNSLWALKFDNYVGSLSHEGSANFFCAGPENQTDVTSCWGARDDATPFTFPDYSPMQYRYLSLRNNSCPRLTTNDALKMLSSFSITL